MQKKSLLWGILGIFVKNPGAISAGLVRSLKIVVLAAVPAIAGWTFWEDALTPLGMMLLMAAAGALDKWVKEYFGAGLALVMALFLAQPAQAQVIKLEPTDFSVGAGSMLGEESTTFSWDAAFAAVHWHGVSLAAENASTGVGVEIHPAAVVSAIEGNVSVQAIETVDWRLWSLNRVKMSVLQIPGDVWESMYLGSDLLIDEGGSLDFTGDFTARFVYGVKEGPIQLELYMFEKYRPISFGFFYRF